MCVCVCVCEVGAGGGWLSVLCLSLSKSFLSFLLDFKSLQSIFLGSLDPQVRRSRQVGGLLEFVLPLYL